MCPSPTEGGATEKWQGISVHTIWQHTLKSLGIKIARLVYFTITRMMMTIHFPLKAFFLFVFLFAFSFNAITLPCSFPQEIDLSSVASH